MMLCMIMVQQVADRYHSYKTLLDIRMCVTMSNDTKGRPEHSASHKLPCSSDIFDEYA